MLTREFNNARAGMLFLWCCATLCAGEVTPLSATTPATPARTLRVLFLTQSCGFRHEIVTRPATPPGALSPAEAALVEIGRRSGVFEAECSQDATQLTPDKLKTLDVLALYTSGDLPLPPKNVTAIQEWARKGGAVVGLHSAADTFKEFRPWYEMLGATFLRHPWNHGAALTRLDPTHPAVAMFPNSFKWNDELCEYHYFDPKKVRVLLSIDMSRSQPALSHAVPVVWVREYGKGRVFYTNFGHGPEAWNSELFRTHLLAGIRWAAKLDDGTAEPNPDAFAHEDQNARLAVLEGLKPWLAKAAHAVGNDGLLVIRAAEKIAREDSASFSKINTQILAAAADEKARAAALKPGKLPTDADIAAVFRTRLEIIHAIVPPPPPPLRGPSQKAP